MIKGTPKANAIVVAKIDTNFAAPTRVIQMKVAYVNDASGETLGWATVGADLLSPETLSLLEQVRESMERDVARRLLLDVEDGQLPVKANAKGLSNFLGVEDDTDAPSI